jgi:hydrogenase maturation protease
MTTLLLGLGNRDRGDDAVGLQVGARVAVRLGLPLAAAGAPGVDTPAFSVSTWAGPDLDLLDQWDGHEHVLVVDASRGAGPPGTRRRVVVDPEDVTHVGRPTGSHAMGLPRVIALGHALGRLPDRLELVTIEAGSVTAGTDLTPAVAAAADRLVDDLVTEFGAEFGAVLSDQAAGEVHRVPG